jgi:hypothetical protein
MALLIDKKNRKDRRIFIHVIQVIYYALFFHRHRFQQRADVYSKSNYHTTRQRSRIQRHKKSENKKVNKRIKLSAEEAKRFGTVVGAAWKAAY